jgi:hypothetical protein
MGTKNDPGDYDCYANAEPGEPMFVLLARDHRAPFLVEAWAAISEMLGGDPKKIAEARNCAASMRLWKQDRAAERAAKLRSETGLFPGQWWSGQTCPADGVYGQYSDATGVRALPGCEYHMTKGARFPPSLNNHHFRLLAHSITITCASL